MNEGEAMATQTENGYAARKMTLGPDKSEPRTQGTRNGLLVGPQ